MCIRDRLTDEKLTQEELEQEDNVLVECLLTDKSELVGQSLMSGNFRRRFGSFILAIRREGMILRKKIAHVILNAYDTLLVYGPENKVNDLSKSGDFIVLGEVDAALIILRVWVMTKLLWDPSRDIDALQQDFIWGFYGQAAPAVSQYYTLLDDLGQGKFNPLNVPFTGVPGLENGVGPWVKPFVIQASTIFARAERLAENQQIRARVLLERASLIYLQLENGPEFANDLNEDYGALIDQFEQIVQPQQTSQLGYRDTSVSYTHLTLPPSDLV